MGNQSGRKKQKATAPVLCARHRGFDLWFEGIGWDLPRTDRMMKGRDNGRYADICGDDNGAMEGLGWEFIAEPICFTATRPRAASNSIMLLSLAKGARESRASKKSPGE